MREGASTMVDVREIPDVHLTRFERFEKGAEGPAWFLPTRKAAMARFMDLGFPTTDDEEWRYTNVGPIAQTVFVRPDEAARVTREQIRAFLLSEESAAIIVLVNGRFVGSLSAPSTRKGLTAGALAAALAAEHPVVREHLARHERFETQPFTALNTALVEDGAFVHVGAGLVVEQPIQILYVSTGGAAAFETHPRTLVLAEPGSQVTVVETFATIDEGVYFTNAVSEIVARDNAVVDHYKVVLESAKSWHIGTSHLCEHRDGTVRSLVATFNGGLVRNDIHTVLDGEGGHCSLNGLYLADGNRHVDNHLIVEHAAAHCDSREFFKGILNDRGKGIFSGRIIVREGAQKTDAKQTNMSLLLSEEAQVESKPQLEIFADDVKCTHGATIGQINEDALFYLRARGIHRETAHSLLVNAFAGEVLDRVRLPSLRKRLDSLVLDQLPGGDLLRERV